MTVYLGNSSWQSNSMNYVYSANTLTVLADEELLATIPGAKELHAYLSEKFPGLVSVEHDYNQNFIVVRGVLYSLFKKFFLDEYEKIQEKTDDNIGEYALKNVDGDYVDIWVEYRDGSSRWYIEDTVSDKKEISVGGSYIGTGTGQTVDVGYQPGSVWTNTYGNSTWTLTTTSTTTDGDGNS